jgi:single-stranded-DNA-specific exonuclease
MIFLRRTYTGIKMKKQFMLRTKKADFAGLAQQLGVDPLTVRLMVNRDIPEEDMEKYLHPSIEDFGNPHRLRDIDKAAELLQQAVKNHKKIRVIGDYDIDGIMSTYILVAAIRQVGGNCDFDIPHRVRDGYGLNKRLVQDAEAAGVELIITCDNGIAAADAIRAGKEAGLTMIVTDHHIVPYREENGLQTELLPPADAIVNPHREGDQYPFKKICGAVVAWKTAIVLYELFGLDEDEKNRFMENAAFATIGDVMPLQEENRSIVRLGISKLKSTQNLGMKALMRAADVDAESITSFTIGFVLGPMFNASGRLKDARLGVDLLLSKDPDEAEQIANELYQLNVDRKEQTEQGTEKALEMSENYSDDKVLVLFLPDVNESVAGIIAGRVRENTGKPSIVLVQGEKYVKGSGRSIPAYSMYQELHKCENLLQKYGGHPMAAGMSLNPEDVDKLRTSLNANTTLTDDDLVEKVYLDCDMPISYLSEKLIHEIENLEPFGNENDKPLFAERNVPVRRIREIGKEGQFLKFELKIPGSNSSMDGLMFRNCEAFKSEFMAKFSEGLYRELLMGRPGRDVNLTITYYPSLNVFRGETSVQVMIQDVIF